MIRYLLIFSCILLSLPAYSQRNRLVVEGSVHGYVLEPGRGLLKRSKSPVLEGTLTNATIEVLRDEQVVATTSTNEQGIFTLNLQVDRLYTLHITKTGYNTNTLLLDTRALPSHVQREGYRFISLEFILNSYSEGKDASLNRNLGRLYYSPNQQAFQLAQTGNGSGAEVDAPLELLKKAIDKNTERINNSEGALRTGGTPARSTTRPATTNVDEADISVAQADSLDSVSVAQAIARERKLTITPSFRYPLEGPVTDDPGDLASREEFLNRAKEQLALDKLLSRTHTDSLTILEREAQIRFAEREIENARLLISQQSSTLEAQRFSMVLLALLLLAVGGSLIMVYSFFRQRQRSSKVIEEKNKQITDSLTYAQRIQQSIFTDEELMKGALPESFVLSLPRDIVSGDFFFFHSYQNKFLVGVADCTGHGVPGAFMSLIGNRLLREIIIEREIYDPATILYQLDQGLQEAFKGQNQNSVVEDGMDIAICQIDPQDRMITFAAAMNPAYLVQGSDIQVLQADVASVGGQLIRKRRKPRPKTFTNKAVSYAPGSMLYMFSDGFMDQFGQEEDEKFNTRRFKDMVMSMQQQGAPQQQKTSLQTFESWQGTLAQTDDVLLLGIRLP